MKRASVVLALAGGIWVAAGAAGCAAKQEMAAPPQAPTAAAGAAAVRCPVTGEEVPNPAEAPSSVYEGVTYYFCCPPCKIDFDKDPAKYVKRP